MKTSELYKRRYAVRVKSLLLLFHHRLDLVQWRLHNRGSTLFRRTIVTEKDIHAQNIFKELKGMVMTSSIT